MIFKNFLKKFKSNKGLTGTDVVVSILIIILTMGVVTSIFINVNNNSKENIRYSGATRIATQVIEKIEATSYDDFINAVGGYTGTGSYSISENPVSGADPATREFLGVKVTNGYGLDIKTSLPSSGGLDIIRNVTVTVKYKLSGNTKDISYYLTKEKEILEQTNKPDLNTLPEIDSAYKYYPVKIYLQGTTKKYLITTSSDPDWYNYEKGNFALIYKSSSASLKVGNTIASYDTSTGTKSGIVSTDDLKNILVWIPRFSSDGANITYYYGKSNIKIQFLTYGANGEISGYSISGRKADGTAISSETGTAEALFKEANGKELSGIWASADTINASGSLLNTFGTYVSKNLGTTSLDLTKLNIPQV